MRLALDARTGALRWEQAVEPGRVIGGNIIVAGDVAVVPSRFTATALGAARGERRWQYTMPLDSASPNGAGPGTLFTTGITHDAEKVYLPAWGGIVSAVTLDSGAEAWVWRDTALAGCWKGATGVVLSGDTLYASLFRWRNGQGTSTDGLLVALDRRDGRELWRLALSPGYRSQGTDPHVWPALWGRFVYIAFRSGSLVAVDRFQGTQAWRRDFTTVHAYDMSPLVADDVLYHYGADDFLYALRPADGQTIWRTRTWQASREMLVTPRRVYLTNIGFLNILDRRTGRFVARVTYPPDETQALTSPAAFIDGIVVMSTSAGTWAFREP